MTKHISPRLDIRGYRRCPRPIRIIHHSYIRLNPLLVNRILHLERDRVAR